MRKGARSIICAFVVVFASAGAAAGGGILGGFIAGGFAVLAVVAIYVLDGHGHRHE